MNLVWNKKNRKLFVKIAKLKIKNSLLLLAVFFVAGFIFFGINVNSSEATFSYYSIVTTNYVKAPNTFAHFGARTALVGGNRNFIKFTIFDKLYKVL
ncbi:hypothetical protein A3I95_00775 [Candidatus Nomurabacteria bacterium RIFCSPLOWO2_02_FULL_44_12]|uniref:Uncharacterized protein n=1 Tax=Candidatus Nomurabacteria bacterium RIFCSPLOWO2_12_FULL_44_11 TaxID=1801796 RepID=A0A1F6Y635_9BACT|nr:MAG: hypothetical protein A3G53_03075 [Candidatus Nomurabacteria bacterium RIFCSPLOWO2_12_FULL_44_11]OGJ07500.1 MAG: hypothetical protein A3I95_00775 [Candidatus Nomurabacteria bacterium RIFCSPLOWO2_02_FULL_44_12]